MLDRQPDRQHTTAIASSSPRTLGRRLQGVAPGARSVVNPLANTGLAIKGLANKGLANKGLANKGLAISIMIGVRLQAARA